MLRKRKELKRNLKPFRVVDEVGMKSSLSAYEWFVGVVAVCQLLVMIYVIIKLIFE